MLNPEEKAFVEAVANTGKFGLMAHAVALSRMLNRIQGATGESYSVTEVFNEMSAASVDVNEHIRETSC